MHAAIFLSTIMDDGKKSVEKPTGWNNNPAFPQQLKAKNGFPDPWHMIL
jgi:hypothetical protein